MPSDDIEGLIAKLDALYEKATKGPWHYTRARKFRNAQDIDHGIGSLYGEQCLIYTTPVDRGCLKDTWERQASDGELIAALHNDYPQLREALATLRQDAGRYRWLRSLDAWPDSELGRVGMTPKQLDEMCDKKGGYK